MTIEIRKAEIVEFEKVFDLIKEFALYIKTPEKVLTTVNQMIEDKEHFTCLIALDKDQIVGFSTYFIAYYSWSGKAIYLDDLYVMQNYRGLGIGSKLFEHVLEIAKNEHCKKVKWQVSNWNSKAIEFYLKRGVKIDEVEINCELSHF